MLGILVTNHRDTKIGQHNYKQFHKNCILLKNKNHKGEPSNQKEVRLMKEYTVFFNMHVEIIILSLQIILWMKITPELVQPLMNCSM